MLYLHCFSTFLQKNAIRRVQLNQVGWKLNATRQLLFYVVDVNIQGGSKHTVNKNAAALVVARIENGLEVIAEKTAYMVMFRYQNAGRPHSIKIDNSSFEWVEEFKYLGITLTNKNCIQE